MKIDKLALLVFAIFTCVTVCISLSGCVNLYAGISQVKVEPFKLDGTMICCRAEFTSGKNAGSVVAHVKKDGEDFTVDLVEKQVNSSQSITAATAGVASISNAVSTTAEAVAPLLKEIK